MRKSNIQESAFSWLRQKGLAAAVAAVTVLGSMAPAWATIDNTVTVTGTAPDTSTVTDDATENVDVIDAIDQLTTTKVSSTAGPVAVGTTITYTYTATNSGNTTLTAVSMADPHDAGASGTLGTITFITPSPLTDNGTIGDSTDGGTDEVWDTLAPGDVITWEATYTVTQDDITNQVGGDGEINNIATASGTDPDSNPITDDSPSVDVPVEAVNSSLAVAKIGTYGGGPTTVDGTTDNLAVGTIVTYTYTITNDGNVPITAISLADVHNGTGTIPAPDADLATLTDNAPSGGSSNGTTGDSQYDVLAPNDVLVVTATYTVTQGDVDTLQ